MCIAILNKAGITLSQDVLTNCWDSNPQGAGLAWVENIDTPDAKVATFSTLTEKELYDTYKMVRSQHPDSNIMLHFRITTHGGTNIFNTHPFWVHEDHLALIHNGIISGYGDKSTNGKSDTNEFATEVLSYLPFGWERNKKIRQLVEDAIGFGNKIVLLNSANEFFILNEARGHWNTKMQSWFSNDGYKQTQWAYHGNQKVYRGGSTGKKSGGVYDAWDDEDFYEKGYSYGRYTTIKSPVYHLADNEMLMELLSYSAIKQKAIAFDEYEKKTSEEEKLKWGTYKTRKYKAFLGELYIDPNDSNTRVVLEKNKKGDMCKIVVSSKHPHLDKLNHKYEARLASSVWIGYTRLEGFMLQEDFINAVLKSQDVRWWMFYQERIPALKEFIKTITSLEWAETLTKRLGQMEQLFALASPEDIAKTVGKESDDKGRSTEDEDAWEDEVDQTFDSDNEVCPNCESKDFEFNEDTGEVECKSCGAVFSAAV